MTVCMPSCPSCGKEVSFDEAYCRNCGFALKSNVGAGAVPTAGSTSSFQSDSIDSEKVSGLQRLKNSFLLYLIGGVISLVPVVGSIGGLLTLIGFIFLILAWRALGRSRLPGALRYKSTGNW